MHIYIRIHLYPTLDVDHSHDKHSKRGGRGKGKSRRPKAKDVDDDDVYDPSTISFTAPPAAAFGYWMREGACQVLIEVALDGQNYVSTNQLIKYESNVKLQKKKR